MNGRELKKVQILKMTVNQCQDLKEIHEPFQRLLSVVTFQEVQRHT